MGVSEFSYFFARSVMIGQTLYQFYDPLISLSFLLCWLPFVIMHMMRSISEQEAFQILFSASIWLGWTNSAINPVIYYSNYEHFRRLKRTVWRHLGRFRRQTARETLSLHIGLPSPIECHKIHANGIIANRNNSRQSYLPRPSFDS